MGIFFRPVRPRDIPAQTSYPAPCMTVRDAITEATRVLNTGDARRDAETLLIDLLGHNRAWLLTHPRAPLTHEQLAAFDILISRRATGEPLQYITGHQEFYGLDFRVTPDVLIPRPETEILVEAVLHWAREHHPADAPMRIADVGTGSGAIAVALAAHLPQAAITAVDISTAALAVAQANATRLGYASRLTFQESDLLNALLPAAATDPFDAIVSNPPYVPKTDAPILQREVRDFEPHTALFAGPDGLEIYRRLVPQARIALRPGGLLAMEFGFGQHEAFASLLAGWQDVRLFDDLAGIPRIALAERP